VTPLVFLHGVGGGRSAWEAQISGYGHLGPMDRPEAFNAVLEWFLKRNAL
jgi:pimeloyl-ACP methyl ester carboxylesterase